MALPSQQSSQRATNNSNNTCISRSYPAIDAILQRKAAIKALQQKHAADAASSRTAGSAEADHTSVITHTHDVLLKQSAQESLTGPTAQNVSRLLTSGPACVCSSPRPAQDCACHNSTDEMSSTMAGTVYTAVSNMRTVVEKQLNGSTHATGSSYNNLKTYKSCSSSGNVVKKEMQQEQQPSDSRSNCDSVPPGGPVDVIINDQQLAVHKDVLHVKEMEQVAYAAEFARIRQHHQQRCSAAAVIQNAVRSWLARRRIEQRTTPPALTTCQHQHHHHQQQQQQASVVVAPHMQMYAQEDVPVASFLWRIQCPEKQHHDAPAAAGTAALSQMDDWSVAAAPDAWEWRKIQKSVGLKCRQVLREHGVYGMAAVYHRGRVEAAVLVWWRSLSRSALGQQG